MISSSIKKRARVKTKICSICGKKKRLVLFNKCSNSILGIRPECKDCQRIASRKYNNEHKQKAKEYREFIKENNPWNFYYHRIMSMCNNPNTPQYKNYGKKGIKNFLSKQDIEHLWFRDNAELMDYPFLIRKNKLDNYTLDNCYFIEKEFFQLKEKNHQFDNAIIEFECFLCHKKVLRKRSITNHTNLIFCSRKCKDIYFVGENTYNYIDGRGGHEYPAEFQHKRNKIRERDNHICQNCSMTEEEHLIIYGNNLDVHHIDYNKKNNNDTNLISLCKQCNIRANFNRDYWKSFYQEKMKFHIEFTGFEKILNKILSPDDKKV